MYLIIWTLSLDVTLVFKNKVTSKKTLLEMVLNTINQSSKKTLLEVVLNTIYQSSKKTLLEVALNTINQSSKETLLEVVLNTINQSSKKTLLEVVLNTINQSSKKTEVKEPHTLFHFKYFIDKSIGLDNRLCLYKSSPTTRWNN